jgi:hypothetical protein
MENSVMVDSATAEVTFPVDVWFDGRRTFDAELDFGGREITKVTLDPHQRFPDESTRDNVWPEPEPVHLSEVVLDRYTGTYEVPGLGELQITREDTTLWVQPTGQRRLQLMPTSETEFQLVEVDAQIVFQVNDDGETTGLVVHQDGQEIEAPKK